jgi:hypothetical protein
MIRGTVTATAVDHLTIKTDAGDVYEVALTPNTRMTKDRQPVKPTDVKVGDGVGAMGELDAPKKTVHALFVAVVDAEQVKKLREDLGKTYITGKVTAIDDVKLTVQRPDNVSQVIEVDETTSFRKGGRRGAGALVMEGGAPVAIGPGGGAPAGQNAGESITLADMKVGDVVAGRRPPRPLRLRQRKLQRNNSVRLFDMTVWLAGFGMRPLCRECFDLRCWEQSSSAG